MSEKLRQPLHRYSLNDWFMCLHEPSGGVYQAKIIGVNRNSDDSGFYTVHYKGWAKRYDEKISFEESELRMFNCTEQEYIDKYGKPEPPIRKILKSTKRQPDRSSITLSMAPDEKRLRSLTEDVATFSASSGSSIPNESSGRAKCSKLAFDKVSTNVHLPPSLHGILVDDYAAISRGFVTTIPAKFNIDRIIRDYIKTIPVRNDDLQNIDDVIIEYEDTEVRVTNLALICTANGIKDYFNFVCGTQLMYPEERSQHSQLIRYKAEQFGLEKDASINTVIAKGFRHTQEYGIVHLVRLLSKLPKMLPTDWEPRLLHRIMIGVHDFVVFLNKNWRHYHQAMDMYTSSAETKQMLIENDEKPKKKTDRVFEETSKEL